MVGPVHDLSHLGVGPICQLSHLREAARAACRRPRRRRRQCLPGNRSWYSTAAAAPSSPPPAALHQPPKSHRKITHFSAATHHPEAPRCTPMRDRSVASLPRPVRNVGIEVYSPARSSLSAQNPCAVGLYSLVDVHVLRLAHGKRHNFREGVGGDGDALVVGVHALYHTGFRDAGGQLGRGRAWRDDGGPEFGSSESSLSAPLLAP